MVKNDNFFKILFAIQLAFLPLVFASNLLMPEWTIGLFVAGILIVKIWLELFKNKDLRSHNVINSIASIATMSTLIIFFTVKGAISVAVCSVAVSLIVLHNIMKMITFKKTMPELIDAVDSCFMMFECLALITLTFVLFYELATNIALFAIVLTAIVSVIYRFYHIIKFSGIFSRRSTKPRKK